MKSKSEVLSTRIWNMFIPLANLITLGELSALIDTTNLEMTIRLSLIEIRHLIQSGSIRIKDSFDLLISLFSFADQYLEIFNSPQGFLTYLPILFKLELFSSNARQTDRRNARTAGNRIIFFDFFHS